MEDLLLLVHRMPYPPNKGDKIRSWHLLKHLAQRYRVHLATFVDDPDDWQPKPLMGRMFWIMLALSVVCVAAGAAVALLAPRFFTP